MARVNPYFTFNGNCEQAFLFYKSVFGGEFRTLMRFSDVGPVEGQPAIPADSQNKIMHVALPISNETILMGSDAHPMFDPITVGQHLSISIDTDSKEEADKIFTALAQGGNVTMPIGDTFWGAYFGMLEDQFGMAWMVNCDKK